MRSPGAGIPSPAPVSCLVPVLLLLALTAAVYWRAGDWSFAFDDHRYIVANPPVLEGLSAKGISWALTTFHASNWHPMTWLSHMTDVEIFGRDAGWHHRVNVLIHGLNTVLLFLVFRGMTGALWRSGFLAALFAVHPLHVESVAWVAERKDLLSALFALLAVWTYVRYARRPTAGRYVLVAFFFVLGLMSKPMVVTLPFVLLLLDWWPLGRLAPAEGEESPPGRFPWGAARRLAVEKAPLVALSAASCALTYLAQSGGRSVHTFGEIPLGLRVANALVSYTGYLGKTVWPAALSVFYPHPAVLGRAIPAWEAGGAVLVLALGCLLAVWQARRRPYVAVGWLWYLGTLVPVIGLVQVGDQAMADRYTYLPLIGLFIVIAWGLPEIMPRWPSRRYALGAAAAVVLAALTIVARQQAGYWRDGLSLFGHALELNPKNYLAHHNLGEALVWDGRPDEAIGHFRAAVKLFPGYALAHYNLGTVLAQKGKLDEAIMQFRESLRYDPENAFAYDNLGDALLRQGKIGDAITCFRNSLKIDDGNPIAHLNLGFALSASGKTDEAVVHYSKALQLNPGFPEAHYRLGWILEQRGRIEEAIGHYREALRIQPGNAAALQRLDALSAGRRE